MDKSFVIVSFCPYIVIRKCLKKAKHGLFYTISGSARIKRTEKLLVKLSIYAVDCVLGGKHYVYKIGVIHIVMVTFEV